MGIRSGVRLLLLVAIFVTLSMSGAQAQIELPELPGGDDSGLPEIPDDLSEKIPLPALAEGGPAREVEVDEVITFDAYSSVDPLDRPMTYQWDFDITDGFGDDPDAEGIEVTHSYESSGQYIVTLTVDNGAVKSYDFIRVAVDGGPGSIRLMPIANAGPDPRNGVVNQSMEFDASASYVPEYINDTPVEDSMVSYNWRFDTSSFGMPLWDSDEAKTEYTFEDEGTYTVLLTLRVGALVDFDTVTVNIKSHANSQPDIVASVPSIAEVGVPVAFDATGSSDPDGDTLTYRWDFDADDSTEYDDTGISTTHTYTQVGNYTVTLWVSDGTVDPFRTFRIQVVGEGGGGGGGTENLPPMAYAGVDLDVQVGTLVTFNGTGFDHDGQVVLYEWDFEGDGIYDFEAEDDGTVVHEYQDIGRYKASLRVTDDDGAQGFDSIYVNVSSGSNSPPLAVAGYDTVVTEGVLLRFNGYGVDTDGTITRYEWDFEGDGTFEYSDTMSGIANYSYPTHGVYNALFRVRDDQLSWGYDSIMVTVREATNKIPRANAGPDAVIVVGKELQLNGSGVDDDGEIVLYEWDLNDDGVFEHSSTQTGRTSVVFDEEGNHTLVLRVTDNNGTTDDDSMQVEVQAHTTNPPVAYFSFTILDDGTVIFDASDSFDGDGLILFYLWDFDGDGDTDLTATDPAGRYTEFERGREYPAMLRVEDDDGLQGNFTYNITVPEKDRETPDVLSIDYIGGWFVDRLNDGNRFLRGQGLTHYYVTVPQISDGSFAMKRTRIIPVMYVVGLPLLLLMLVGIFVGIRGWRRRRKWPVFKRIGGEPYQELFRGVTLTCAKCDVSIKTKVPPGKPIQGVTIRCPRCGHTGEPAVTSKEMASATKVPVVTPSA